MRRALLALTLALSHGLRVAVCLAVLSVSTWAQDYPPELEPLVPPERALAAWGFYLVPDDPIVADASPTNPVTIDILYVRLSPGVSTTICDAIAARFNEINTNSGVGFVTARAVGGCRATTQPSSGSLSTDLGRATSKTDGWYDEIHGWRDEAGADLVQVILASDSGGYAGLGYQNATATSAFSAVVAAHAVGYMSGPHEHGHNLTLHHDRQTSTNTVFPYGYDWRASTWRTVMAYAPGNRIPYWSNKDVTCPNAVPCGTLTDDNARVMRARAPVVALFRSGPATTPWNPAAPGKPRVCTEAGICSSSGGRS